MILCKACTEASSKQATWYFDLESLDPRIYCALMFVGTILANSLARSEGGGGGSKQKKWKEQ